MTVFRRFLQKKRPPPVDSRGWWGSTGLHMAIGLRGITLIFFGLFLCAALVLVYGQYVRKVAVEGVLEPQNGEVLLIAPDNGMLRKLLVHSGDRVRKGDVLAEFSVLRKASSNEAGRGEIAALQRSLDGYRSTSNLHQQDGYILGNASLDQSRLLNEESIQAKQELDKNILTEQFSAAEMAKLKLLVAEGIRSTHELANAEIAYLRVLNESARTRQNIARIEGRKVEIKAQLQREKSALARQGNETESRIDQLDVELDRALRGESFLIKATQDGIVDSIFGQTGGSVQSGETVATISDPAVPLQALMFIRASEIGFVRKNDQVMLQIDAFPSQQFGSVAGKIVDISLSALTNNQFKKLANLKEGERSYLAIVALEKSSMAGYGEQWKLRAGMTYKGYVALEQQSLFRWIFNPVFVALGRNPHFFDRITESK